MAEELVPASTLKGIFSEQTFLVIVFWVVFIMGLILFLLFVVFGLWYLTYRIRVRYYQSIGKDKDNKEILRFIGTDKAKLIKLKGNIYNLRFFWKRRKIEPPPDEAYTPTKKGFEIFIKTDGIDFHPFSLRLAPNPHAAEIVPMHKRLWLIQTQKQAIEQYSKPSFWEKYGNIILTFGTVILCLSAMAFTIWYAAKLAERAINAYSPAILEAARNTRIVAPGA